MDSRYIKDLPVSERMRLYNRAMELHKEEGLGKRRIAKKLGILVTTAGSWVNGGQRPNRSSSKFRDWKPRESGDLSYILGVLRGDGGAYKLGTSYVVKLECKDKEFAKAFRNSLNGIRLNPWLSKYGPYWEVGASGKGFVEWVISLTLEDTKEAVEGHECDFLRGFYDSDGSLRTPHHEIRFTNNDLNLLLLVQRMLSSLGIESKIYYADSFRLWFGGKLAVKKFLKLVEPTIPRRRNIEEPYPFVRCKICNEKFGGITPSHLLKHDMTIEDYRNKFPDAKLRELSNEHKRKIGESGRGTAK